MSFLMSNIMTSHCNESTLKGVIKPHCSNFLSAQAIRREQVEPRPTLRALSYFADGVLSRLPASMQLSAVTGVRLEELPVGIGNATWLHRAGDNDLLQRTPGCCETHLLFWHSGRSAGIPDTRSDLCDDVRLR